jgi:hypothetical protein
MSFLDYTITTDEFGHGTIVPSYPTMVEDGEPVESRLFDRLCEIASRQGGFEQVGDVLYVYLTPAKRESTHYYFVGSTNEGWCWDWCEQEEYCCAQSVEEFLSAITW